MLTPDFKIFVIIPTCHRNDLLALCLDHLAPGAQTLSAEHYEVIVTDDGSKMTAEELVRERYPWVRWVAGPCRGPAANRNQGAALAKGPWLAFTDDDCLPTPGWLQAFAEAITPEFDVYEGKTSCKAGIKSPLYHAPVNLNGGYLWSCNMMIAAALFRDIGGFDESFPYPHLEDVYFRDRLQTLGHPYLFVSSAVVDHPPRKTAFGSHLGATHECEVIYNYKRDCQATSLISLVASIIKFRGRSLLHARLSKDSLILLMSTILELNHVVRHLHFWNTKHSSLQR